MSPTWLTFSGNVLLLLFGVQLSIAAFFLFPSYVEYARDIQHLGVDLHHILVGDRFTNVGAVFCVLYPIPVLCSLGSAHNVRPLSDSTPVAHPFLRPSVSPPVAVSDSCDCLSDALVSQHVFFGQLELSILRIERIVEFLASSPVSFVTLRFARDDVNSRADSPVHEEVAAVLQRVDAAFDVAHKAVTRLVMNAEFAFFRIRFAHHVAFSGLKLVTFVHNFLFFFNPVYAVDDTLRRAIEYLVPVTMASAETSNTDVVIAVGALRTLLDAIAVDAFNTLLRAHSSFLDHRQAITHCATTSSSSSPICAAIEMLLHNVSTVQSMRDDLATLKGTVKMCSKDLDRFFTCAKTPQRCTLDRALQLLSSSESYLVEFGASAKATGEL